jgi:hypothetical protein
MAGTRGKAERFIISELADRQGHCAKTFAQAVIFLTDIIQ